MHVHSRSFASTHVRSRAFTWTCPPLRARHSRPPGVPAKSAQRLQSIGHSGGRALFCGQLLRDGGGFLRQAAAGG
eukprot:11216964-Lingulodinium_polyedra.AAC.1